MTGWLDWFMGNLLAFLHPYWLTVELSVSANLYERCCVLTKCTCTLHSTWLDPCHTQWLVKTNRRVCIWTSDLGLAQTTRRQELDPCVKLHCLHQGKIELEPTNQYIGRLPTSMHILRLCIKGNQRTLIWNRVCLLLLLTQYGWQDIMAGGGVVSPRPGRG